MRIGMKATSSLSLVTFVLVLGLGTAASLNAAAYSWDGGAGNDRWDAADNWNPNIVPSAGDDVTFATNTSLTNGIVAIGAGFKLNSLTVDIPAFGTIHGGNPFINLGDTKTLDQLTFRTDLSGSIKDTNSFKFDNAFTSSWSQGASTFTITATPGPSTYVAAAGLLGLLAFPLRRCAGARTMRD
jgi:hypothetical protein